MAFTRLASTIRRVTSFAHYVSAIGTCHSRAISTQPKPQHIGKYFNTVHSGVIGSDGLPLSVDWRNLNGAPRIRNQGDCGGCWAFATRDAVQFANVIAGNEPEDLSVQQLLDCVDVNCSGCISGHEIPAYDYIKANGGLVTEEKYPFVGFTNGKYRHVTAKGVTISDFKFYTNVEDQFLKELVTCQPVVAVVGADKIFEAYTHGVADGLNYDFWEMRHLGIAHVVVIVGYGVDDLLRDYWIVKNSWGKEFGLDGYICILRNSGREGGAFGINRAVSYLIKTCPNASSITVRSESDMGLPRWPSHKFRHFPEMVYRRAPRAGSMTEG